MRLPQYCNDTHSHDGGPPWRHTLCLQHKACSQACKEVKHNCAGRWQVQRHAAQKCIWKRFWTQARNSKDHRDLFLKNKTEHQRPFKKRSTRPRLHALRACKRGRLKEGARKRSRASSQQIAQPCLHKKKPNICACFSVAPHAITIL